MILYRPVGTAELNLIAESGYHSFPPRLPEQPIFYPVLNRRYACQVYREFPINLVIRKNELSGMPARSAVMAPFLLVLFPITLSSWPVVPAKIRKRGN